MKVLTLLTQFRQACAGGMQAYIQLLCSIIHSYMIYAWDRKTDTQKPGHSDL